VGNQKGDDCGEVIVGRDIWERLYCNSETLEMAWFLRRLWEILFQSRSQRTRSLKAKQSIQNGL
jgi:hypothetical protein